MEVIISKPAFQAAATDVLIVGSFEDSAKLVGASLAIDTACGGALLRQAASEGFKGKVGQTVVHFTDGKLGAPKVVLVGLGPKGKLDVATLRLALAGAFRKTKELKAADVSIAPLALGSTRVSRAQFAEAVATVAASIDYVINHQKTRGDKAHHISVLRILSTKSKNADMQAGLVAGRIIGACVNHARDMSNEPAGTFTPSKMQTEAEAVVARSNGAITARYLGKDELTAMGAGAILAVNQGSPLPPVLIELTYTPPTGATKEVLGFVGKSITFDSGGLDLKPADGMRNMKRDMSGGASTLAAIEAVAQLQLPISVKAFMAATENMPDGNSYKPGDVIVTLKGLTVEVDNTDAEGRLTLADAIEYAKRQGVTCIIDLATLTGAIRQFGHDVGAGLFSNNRQFAAKIVSAADKAGERLGELPMWPELRDMNKSEMADLKNSGGAGAGATTAAWFIREFAGEDIPWAHLDIAGTAFRDRELGADPKGATGYGVRLLVELARAYAAAAK
jgi:leucyl aminopeptidase